MKKGVNIGVKEGLMGTGDIKRVFMRGVKGVLKRNSKGITKG